MLQGAYPQPTHELRHDLALAGVFERCDRRHEVARLRKALRADWAELGEPERSAIVLAHVATRLLLEQADLEFHAAWHDADLAGRKLQPAELREDKESSLLWDEHQLAIGAIEVAPLHRAIGAIDVDRDSVLPGGIARAGERG